MPHLGSFTHAVCGERLLELGAASRLYFHQVFWPQRGSLWTLINEVSTVANHRRILRGRINSADHENRKRNHTCDNSDACRDKSEDARTSPTAANTGFSLGASGVSPLLRKRRRETSRS